MHGTAASTSLKSTVILLYLCCGGESILVRSRTKRFGSIGGLIKALLVVLDFTKFSYPCIYFVKNISKESICVWVKRNFTFSMLLSRVLASKDSRSSSMCCTISVSSSQRKSFKSLVVDFPG